MLLCSLGTSLTMDQFAWTKAEALYYMGILMSVGAVVACVTFVVIKPLCKRWGAPNMCSERGTGNKDRTLWTTDLIGQEGKLRNMGI